ncbi:MAG TPA: SRPBCC family protein [Steroidobacteraceae bacterium]|nr:SRPBCC family protein [Steroidobacteraceae bacterium]
MKIVKTILVGLVALIVLLIVIALFLPAAAHVERSVSISAPPAVVFDIVNSLRRFNEWSPWYELDPAARFTYSGPENGVGARVEWTSENRELGAGSQEIVESVPLQHVRTQLDFAGDGQADVALKLVPEGQGTNVTWSLDRPFGYNLPSRYFGLWLDRALGPYYEKGLGNLKVIAEAEATAPPATAALQITDVELSALDIVYVPGTSAPDPEAIATALTSAYAALNAFLKANQLQPSGQPLAINEFFDESGWGFEAAIPFRGSEAARARAAQTNGPVKIGQTYAGRALKGVHIGPRSTLPDTYRQLEDHMAQQHLEPNGRSWEQYMSDTRGTPQDQVETHVYLPVKPGA